MMQEPLHCRSFPNLRTVCSTAWEHSALDGVLNFRALMVDQTFPDLVSEVSKRMEKEHFNYTQLLVGVFGEVARLTVCRTRSACCRTASMSWG